MSTASPPDGGTRVAPPPLSSDPAVLEAQIEERRLRLASTVDELAQRVKPAEVARRTAAGAQERVKAATTAEDGSLRIERIAAVAAAALAAVGLLVWARSRRR